MYDLVPFLPLSFLRKLLPLLFDRDELFYSLFDGILVEAEYLSHLRTEISNLSDTLVKRKKSFAKILACLIISVFKKWLV